MLELHSKRPAASHTVIDQLCGKHSQPPATLQLIPPCCSLELLPHTFLMSAESDLLFAQADTLMFPDIGQLPEFEDFTKDLLLGTGIEDFTGGELLEDLDCKDDLKPLLMHAFSSSMEDEKDGGKVDPHSPPQNSTKRHENSFMNFVNGSSQSSKLGQPPCDSPSNGGLELMSAVSGAVSSVSAEQNEILSPRTMIATSKLNCMSLNEMRVNSDEPFTTSPLSPSARHSNSQVSSPSSTVSTSDGSCSGGKTTTPRNVSGLLNRMLGHEENFNIQIRCSSVGQPTDLTSINECSSVFGRQSPRADAPGNCRGAIPPHVMQEASQLPSLQRSHSSHALGQLRTVGHAGACTEDFRLSPAPGVEMPTPGLSKLGPYNQLQLSDFQGMNLRSPIASMRRVYSTGDLQAFNGMQVCYGGSNLLPLEHSNIEEAGGLKIGHYTLEERKMKLHRYRQKRSERNFNKKIKYACRKTLADSRPRIRGRFARTDDIGESVMKVNGAQHDEEDEEGDAVLEAEHKFLMSNSNGGNYWDIAGMKAAV